MNIKFEQILDLCIDRINSGESLEACLQDYPEYAEQLEPLLITLVDTKKVYAFTPSTEAKRESRKRFYDAMERKRRPSLIEWFRARPLALGTIASVIVVFLITFFALRATVFTVNVPSNIPTTTISNPASSGNFIFLVSDDINAIADFSSVSVTIEKVELLKSGDSSQIVEFVPEIKEFDLSQLPGEKTQQLWRGDLPEGTYTKETIYVSRVQGVLLSGGETVDIKLPSDKLQLSLEFEVGLDTVTSFTYDLTVIKTGSDKNSKYILKPQAGESGSSQLPNDTKKPDVTDVARGDSAASDSSTKGNSTEDKGKLKK
jgi:hypothetical protein